MAKRKRLEIPVGEANFPDSETNSTGMMMPRVRMPIADVAGDTAGRAALEEVAREMTAAEEEGRVVKKLPLEAISIEHLQRDRMVLDPEELDMLKASLLERGQQTPVEVVRTGNAYGLISGLRRIVALKAIGETHVLALVRKPDTAAEAYRAMVEENEIRADLSFYERAHIAALCAEKGVYASPREAVSGLFAHAPGPKRSKILKFIVICEALGDVLRFPAAIPEKLGLKLATALEADRRLAGRISGQLRRADLPDAAAERRVLERVLKPETRTTAAVEEIAPGVTLQMRKGRAVLSGRAVDEGFQEALRSWVLSRAKTEDTKP